MDTADYKHLKEVAEREYRLNLEAIERVKRMQETPPTEGALPVSDSSNRLPMPKMPKIYPRAGGKIANAVRAVIAAFDGQFTRNDVKLALQARYPVLVVKPGSLKAVMNRLAASGEIKVLVAAMGRRHAVYRRGTITGSKEGGSSVPRPSP
jgi:hypothetical protein